MGVIKLPSNYLIITKGPHKGLHAEFISRINEGVILNVMIGATGYIIPVKIVDVVFVMGDGATAWFEEDPNTKELTRRVKHNKVVDIVVVEEEPESPTKDEIVFDTDIDDADIVEGSQLSSMDIEGITDFSIGNSHDIVFGTSENNLFSNTERKNSDTDRDNNNMFATIVNKKYDKITELFISLIHIIGIGIDNTGAVVHAKTMKKALDNVEEFDIDDTTNVKTFILAYMFIWINNMGANIIMGNKDSPTPNDDPNYILEFVKDKGYFNDKKKRKIEDSEVKSIDSQIKILLEKLNRSIFPAPVLKDQELKRFKIMAKRKVKKLTGFSLYTKGNVYSTEIKNEVLNKFLENEMNTKVLSVQSIEDFRDNFDKYLIGKVGFPGINRTLSNNEKNIFSKYVKEYRDKDESSKLVFQDIHNKRNLIPTDLVADIKNDVRISQNAKKHFMDNSESYFFGKYYYRLRSGIISQPLILEYIIKYQKKYGGENLLIESLKKEIKDDSNVSKEVKNDFENNNYRSYITEDYYKNNKKNPNADPALVSILRKHMSGLFALEHSRLRKIRFGIEETSNTLKKIIDGDNISVKEDIKILNIVRNNLDLLSKTPEQIVTELCTELAYSKRGSFHQKLLSASIKAREDIKALKDLTSEQKRHYIETKTWSIHDNIVSGGQSVVSVSKIQTADDKVSNIFNKRTKTDTDISLLANELLKMSTDIKKNTKIESSKKNIDITSLTKKFSESGIKKNKK